MTWSNRSPQPRALYKALLTLGTHLWRAHALAHQTGQNVLTTHIKYTFDEFFLN